MRPPVQDSRPDPNMVFVFKIQDLIPIRCSRDYYEMKKNEVTICDVTPYIGRNA